MNTFSYYLDFFLILFEKVFFNFSEIPLNLKAIWQIPFPNLTICHSEMFIRVFFLSKDLNNFRCLGCRYIDEIFVFSLKAKWFIFKDFKEKDLKS